LLVCFVDAAVIVIVVMRLLKSLQVVESRLEIGDIRLERNEEV
jgi:hypothetical protein